MQGREWERFAWLKSRVVAPRAASRSGRALALRGLVTAFVYRRYLDYGVFEGLRQLHAKVRDEAQRRAAGRPERANDVKLSRGGIREIEFIVQLLLVVRGGQFPEIRTRSTLKALAKLAAGGLMKPDSAARLAEAYTFLRRVEHRIQYLDDQQTHLLPTAGRRPRLDRAQPGPGSCDGRRLRAARPARRDARVRRDRVRRAAARRPRAGRRREARQRLPDLRTGGPCRSTARRSSSTCRPSWPRASGRSREQPRVQPLRDDSKLRLARLVQRAAHAVSEARCTLEAALRFIDWIEPLLRRESYLALLVERPEVQNRLLRLLGLARWPMRYLMLHPGVIDELADERLLHSRFEPASFQRDLEERHAAWERSGQADEELAARHAAPRPPRRGLPHAGARRRGPHHGRAGRRRPVGAGRRDARACALMGLAAPEAAPSRRPALRRHRLRQARRQGARLRQRPRRRLPLRRCRRARRRQGDRGLRRLRAQADHLADDAHAGRRAVRHRHRAAAERQLGPAGDLDRRVRALPERPRQQHRLDLGAPGPDARALLRRRCRPRGARSRRCGAACCSAPRDAVALRDGGAGDAREGARRRIRSRPAASTSSTAPAA